MCIQWNSDLSLLLSLVSVTCPYCCPGLSDLSLGVSVTCPYCCPGLSDLSPSQCPVPTAVPVVSVTCPYCCHGGLSDLSLLLSRSQ
ncbi:unnamed protein product [Boreogadus saida]